MKYRHQIPQPDHRYIYECEKKPDFTAVLTTTVIAYWQSSDSDSVTSDFCRLATSQLKYTCSIIVGI